MLSTHRLLFGLRSWCACVGVCVCAGGWVGDVSVCDGERCVEITGMNGISMCGVWRWIQTI